MITSSGLYVVTVSEDNNPTYLRGGLYNVVVNRRGTEASFRSVVSGAGTFERKVMLDVFEKQGWVVCTPVSRKHAVRFVESHGLKEMQLIDWAERFPAESSFQIAVRQSTVCMCGNPKVIGEPTCRHHAKSEGVLS